MSGKPIGLVVRDCAPILYRAEMVVEGRLLKNLHSLKESSLEQILIYLLFNYQAKPTFHGTATICQYVFCPNEPRERYFCIFSANEFFSPSRLFGANFFGGKFFQTSVFVRPCLLIVSSFFLSFLQQLLQQRRGS